MPDAASRFADALVRALLFALGLAAGGLVLWFAANVLAPVPAVAATREVQLSSASTSVVATGPPHPDHADSGDSGDSGDSSDSSGHDGSRGDGGGRDGSSDEEHDGHGGRSGGGDEEGHHSRDDRPSSRQDHGDDGDGSRDDDGDQAPAVTTRATDQGDDEADDESLTPRAEAPADDDESTAVDAEQPATDGADDADGGQAEPDPQDDQRPQAGQDPETGGDPETGEDPQAGDDPQASEEAPAGEETVVPTADDTDDQGDEPSQDGNEDPNLQETVAPAVGELGPVDTDPADEVQLVSDDGEQPGRPSLPAEHREIVRSTVERITRDLATLRGLLELPTGTAKPTRVEPDASPVEDAADEDAADQPLVDEGTAVQTLTTPTDGSGRLDLEPWKLQLPTGEEESPDEVEQPALDEYSADPYFVPTSEGTRFRAPVDGVTTSGSDNPRSELREMDGDQEAAWDPSSGSHELSVEQTVTRLPEGKDEMVVAQIHDADDDVTAFRVEGDEMWVTDGDEPGQSVGAVQVGEPFRVGYDVSEGEIHALYNGQQVATLPAEGSGYYFKTGAYVQANCSNSPCSGDNYGETVLTDVQVSHGVDGREEDAAVTTA